MFVINCINPNVKVKLAFWTKMLLHLVPSPRKLLAPWATNPNHVLNVCLKALPLFQRVVPAHLNGLVFLPTLKAFNNSKLVMNVNN